MRTGVAVDGEGNVCVADFGKKKKQKKAARCWSTFTLRKSAKKQPEKHIAGGAIDVGSSGLEIPGGLAGICERMAQMGHSINATRTPSPRKKKVPNPLTMPINDV